MIKKSKHLITLDSTSVLLFAIVRNPELTAKTVIDVSKEIIDTYIFTDEMRARIITASGGVTGAGDVTEDTLDRILSGSINNISTELGFQCPNVESNIISIEVRKDDIIVHCETPDGEG